MTTELRPVKMNLETLHQKAKPQTLLGQSHEITIAREVSLRTVERVWLLKKPTLMALFVGILFTANTGRIFPVLTLFLFILSVWELESCLC